MTTPWIWIIIGAAAAGAPILFVKRYLADERLAWIAASLASYSLLVYAYVKILGQGGEISILYPLVKITSILLVVGAGGLLLGDRLNVKGWLGIVLAIVAIYLLSTE
jgi:hypothetical protein